MGGNIKWFNYLLFTFHYGSILISSWQLDIIQICIYTPLWFYSNLGLIFFLPATHLFTFHYGSILIDTQSRFYRKRNKFTFHYGSILIFYSMPATSSIEIYIPLWFYSNWIRINSTTIAVSFTFHYGSILIF